MNMPSFYQGDLFRALVATGRIDLRVIFARRVTVERQQLGWTDDLNGYRSEFLHPRHALYDATRLAREQRDRIHIVNGLWAEPAFAAALSMLALQSSRYVIYSEAPDPRIQRSLAQRGMRFLVGRMFASQARAWLPVSHFACSFYKSLGGAEVDMYPFGYFRAVSPHHGDCTEIPRHNDTLSVLFVGQITERKGLDLLLSAIGALRTEHPRILLTVIGDGPARLACEEQARALGLEHTVNFEGVLSSAVIPQRVSRADALILPSLWDGWGLVVNEALAAGVPAIVSDLCGAADLVEHGVNGYVFRGGDADALTACLRVFMKDIGRLDELRKHAAATGRAISAEAAAKYLVACLQHMTQHVRVRPVPPWKQPEGWPS